MATNSLLHMLLMKFATVIEENSLSYNFGIGDWYILVYRVPKNIPYKSMVQNLSG